MRVLLCGSADHALPAAALRRLRLLCADVSGAGTLALRTADGRLSVDGADAPARFGPLPAGAVVSFTVK
jgi:hypothetical protein